MSRRRARAYLRLGCGPIGCSVPLLAALAAIVAAVLLAACGGTPSAPQTGTPAANTLVCKHYLTQRAWVKNLTQPTLKDGVQFLTDLNVDAAQAAGQLHADLASMVKNAGTQGKAYYDASTRVYNDCRG